MKNSYHPHWTNVSDISDLELVERVLTGTKRMSDFHANYGDIAKMKLPHGKPVEILDFGSGPLRNTIGFLNLDPVWRVTAFDNDAMLARGVGFFTTIVTGNEDRLTVESDWTKVSHRKFDVVYAALVFQHIKEHYLRGYLKWLQGMTPALYVNSRRVLDDQKTSVWQIVQDYFSITDVMSGDSKTVSAGAPDDHHFIRFSPKPIILDPNNRLEGRR